MDIYTEQEKRKFIDLGRDVPKADNYIRGAYIALICISFIEFYSASSATISHGAIFRPLLSHAFSLTLGVVVMFLFSRIHFSHYVWLIPILAVASAVAAFLTMFLGDTVNGAHRTISLGFINIQPPEFIKLSAALIIAMIMAFSQLPDRPGVSNKGIFWSAFATLLFGGLLFSDGLTNTILMMAISLSVMVLGGIDWKKLMIVLIVYGIVGAVGVVYKVKRLDSSNSGARTEQAMTAPSEAEVIAGHKKSDGGVSNRSGEWIFRLTEFFSDDSIPLYKQKITSKNSQKVYSYMAQAHGGVFGVMPGNARENTRLPLVSSDFIYALIIEDFGLIGGLFVMLIYLFIFVRAGDLSRRCDNAFPKLLIVACGTMIVFQALFHMAIVTGTFPVSGQQLPMISRGGTSILVTSIAFGIILSVTRYADIGSTKKRTKKRKGDDANNELSTLDNIDATPMSDEEIKAQLD